MLHCYTAVCLGAALLYSCVPRCLRRLSVLPEVSEEGDISPAGDRNKVSLQYVTSCTICYFVHNMLLCFQFIYYFLDSPCKPEGYLLYVRIWLLYYRVIIFESRNALNCRVPVKESSMNNLILHEMLIENI